MVLPRQGALQAFEVPAVLLFQLRDPGDAKDALTEELVDLRFLERP